MPQRPARSASQKASLPEPMAVMTHKPVIATRLGAGIAVLLSAVSALQRPVPLLGLQPAVNVAAAEPPVLAHLGSRNPAALRQGIQGGLVNLEVAVQLLNRQNIGIDLWHRLPRASRSPTGNGHKKVTPVISYYWLLYNKPSEESQVGFFRQSIRKSERLSERN